MTFSIFGLSVNKQLVKYVPDCLVCSQMLWACADLKMGKSRVAAHHSNHGNTNKISWHGSLFWLGKKLSPVHHCKFNMLLTNFISLYMHIYREREYIVYMYIYICLSFSMFNISFPVQLFFPRFIQIFYTTISRRCILDFYLIWRHWYTNVWNIYHEDSCIVRKWMPCPA